MAYSIGVTGGSAKPSSKPEPRYLFRLVSPRALRLLPLFFPAILDRWLGVGSVGKKRLYSDRDSFAVKVKYVDGAEHETGQDLSAGKWAEESTKEAVRLKRERKVQDRSNCTNESCTDQMARKRCNASSIWHCLKTNSIIHHLIVFQANCPKASFNDSLPLAGAASLTTRKQEALVVLSLEARLQEA